jgi:hypothetical protein
MTPYIHPTEPVHRLTCTSPLVMLFLHRAFLARALADTPHDPLRSLYAPSVHAALRGARETITWARSLVRAAPRRAAHLHYVWSIALTAAMIHASLANTAPFSTLAPLALIRLREACELFRAGEEWGSKRAAASLVSSLFTVPVRGSCID